MYAPPTPEGLIEAHARYLIAKFFADLFCQVAAIHTLANTSLAPKFRTIAIFAIIMAEDQLDFLRLSCPNH